MNADSFAQLLANPSRLHQLPYRELRSLLLDYPWCQTLRMLVALKSKMDKLDEAQADMEMAAAYAPNRQYWYQQISSDLAPEAINSGFVMQDDFLELMDLSELDTVEHNKQEDPGQVQLEISEKEQGTEPGQPEDWDSEHEPEPSPIEGVEQVEEDEAAVVIELFDEVEKEFETQQTETTPRDADDTTQPQGVQDGPAFWQPAIREACAMAALLETHWRTPSPVDHSASTEAKKEKDHPQPTTSPTDPEPKSSFSSWLRQFAAPHPLKDWREETHPAIAEKAEPQADIHAEKSVTESDELASETLAILLERQGQFQKAIEIYERLRLKFPEKSAFFADKIQELKNTL